jgi:hypothetical protein
MMMKQFCDSILQLKITKSKALVNLVMGLSSQTSGRSTVSLSSSPCYHDQFSSISKSIKGLYIESEQKKASYTSPYGRIIFSNQKALFPKAI